MNYNEYLNKLLRKRSIRCRQVARICHSWTEGTRPRARSARPCRGLSLCHWQLLTVAHCHYGVTDLAPVLCECEDWLQTAWPAPISSSLCPAGLIWIVLGHCHSAGPGSAQMILASIFSRCRFCSATTSPLVSLYLKYGPCNLRLANFKIHIHKQHLGELLLDFTHPIPRSLSRRYEITQSVTRWVIRNNRCHSKRKIGVSRFFIEWSHTSYTLNIKAHQHSTLKPKDCKWSTRLRDLKLSKCNGDGKCRNLFIKSQRWTLIVITN